jgi:hypothetical protein
MINNFSHGKSFASKVENFTTFSKILIFLFGISLLFGIPVSYVSLRWTMSL